MSKYCFGVDIGGTTVKLGLFEKNGEVVDKWEIPTHTADGGKNILPEIAESIKAKMTEKSLAAKDIVGVGMCAPGPVDSNGLIYRAVNLNWGVMNIKDQLSELTGLKVVAGNDANVAALGEMWKGGGMGHKDVVVVTLGTGVGGGIIIDGKILTGAIGAGGEVGHIHIQDDEEEACGCGNYGCLEQYASATGVVRLAKRRLAKDKKASSLRDVKNITAKHVFDAVKEGDEVAKEIAEQFGEYLGKGLASIAAVSNPDIIVIGGGVSKAGEVLIDYVRKYYRQYVFHASRDASFVLATLGNDAGIFGAAKLVLDEN